MSIFSQEERVFAETESLILQQGYTPLDAGAITSHLVGKTFIGRFPPVFKYVVCLNEDGSLEGKNNCQHYDEGVWEVDGKNNTLSVVWKFGWISSINRVYQIGRVFRLFDASSGKLNTLFDDVIRPVKNIKMFDVELCCKKN